MKKEKRSTFTYSTLPKLKKAAAKRAKKEGQTLSGVIEMMLMGYIAAAEWKDMQGNPLTPNSIILDPRPIITPSSLNNIE